MPISKPPGAWRDRLAATLARLQRPDRSLKIAIVGVGHELRGDDAAGIAVARALKSGLPKSDGRLVIDAGPAPENHTGPLRRFAPDLVLLIDAAQMDEAPGTVQWLAWRDIDGLSASTHTLPLHLLARYLTTELGCEVASLGIQPADTSIGAPLSPEVQTAVDALAIDLTLGRPPPSHPPGSAEKEGFSPQKRTER